MPISSVEALMKKKWNMKSCVDTKPQSARTTKISDRKTHIELQLKASRSTIRRNLKKSGQKKAVTMTTPPNILLQDNLQSNSNDTKLQTPGTKWFGVMRAKVNFMVTTRDTMNGSHLTDSARVCKLMSTTVSVDICVNSSWLSVKWILTSVDNHAPYCTSAISSWLTNVQCIIAY